MCVSTFQVTNGDAFFITTVPPATDDLPSSGVYVANAHKPRKFDFFQDYRRLQLLRTKNKKSLPVHESSKTVYKVDGTLR